ncbi:hypothetical protein UFOVP711_3 [uncultured Caudovirales phage]|uniref:Uncharacterized protein n=1 Tax=uncultured Caudovirales phage TaxID=2100421 RepID=A0A6J5NI81_9CAUD|nr:hypothetical protein UFOVP711_3 [uncultured Caudovirales phage]
MGARKMVKLKVIETSGVDHPAHLNEGWVVMKHQDPETTEGAEVSEETEAIETTEADVITESLVKAQERIAELEEALEVEKAKKKPAFLAEVEVEAEDEEDEDMMKSVPEAVREMLNKAKVEADVAREELRKEREERRDAEFVAKAEASWGLLPVDASEVGKAMRRLTDVDAPLAETIAKALDAANAQAESANIFAEIGTAGRPDTGDAYGKVQALAKSLVADGKASTVEQAVVDLISADPTLYHEYVAEKRR